MRKRTWISVAAIMASICIPFWGEVKAPDIQTIKTAFQEANARTTTLQQSVDIYIQVKSADSEPGPEELDMQQVLARTKDLLYYEVQNSASGKVCRASYDGKECRVLFSNSKKNTQREIYLRSDPPKRAGMQSMQPDLVPFLLNIWDEDMLWHFEGDEFSISPDPVMIENASCYVVSGKVTRFNPPLDYRLYVDPAIGFMPRRTELLGQDGAVKSTRDFLGYEEVEKGLWFPKRMQVVSKSGVNIYIVTKLEVNKPVPDDALKVVQPDNAKVIDERGSK
jgi:hypothetical protein